MKVHCRKVMFVISTLRCLLTHSVLHQDNTVVRAALLKCMSVESHLSENSMTIFGIELGHAADAEWSLACALPVGTYCYLFPCSLTVILV